MPITKETIYRGQKGQNVIKGVEFKLQINQKHKIYCFINAESYGHHDVCGAEAAAADRQQGGKSMKHESAARINLA